VKYSINLHRSLQLVSQDIHIHIESVKNPQEPGCVAVGRTNHLTETGSWPMTPRAVVIPPTESIHPRVHLPGITVTSDPGWPTTIDTDTLMRCGVWWDGWVEGLVLQDLRAFGFSVRLGSVSGVLMSSWNALWICMRPQGALSAAPPASRSSPAPPLHGSCARIWPALAVILATARECRQHFFSLFVGSTGKNQWILRGIYR